MCAWTGIVVPELLDGTNHVAWFDAGATIFSPKGIQYLGVPGLINAKNIIATVAVQVPCSNPARLAFFIFASLSTRWPSPLACCGV